MNGMEATVNQIKKMLIGVIEKQNVVLEMDFKEIEQLVTTPDTREISFTSNVNQTYITEDTENKVIENLPSEIEIQTERPSDESGIEKIEIIAKKVNSIILELKATPGIFKSVKILKLAILTLVRTIHTAGEIDVNVENTVTVNMKFGSLTKDQIEVVKCLFTNKWNKDKMDKPLSHEYQSTDEGATINSSLVVATNSHQGIFDAVPSESFKRFTRAPCQSCEEKDKQIKALEEKTREHAQSMDRYSFLDANLIADERTPRRSGHSLPVSLSTKEFDSKHYKIKSGLVLVLNNTEFLVQNIPLADRVGSDIDVSSISQRFQELGFRYNLQTNLTKSATFEWFKKVKEDFITKPVDCFVLVLLSHGADLGVYATDELISTIDIQKTFNSEMCPALRFKPKIIIMQSCRGSHLSRGIDSKPPPNQADASVDRREYILLNDEDRPIHLPNEADFLFAFATVPGSRSFRTGTDGTPFIRHLCIAIGDMKENEDFYSVLTTVNKAVGMTYKPYIGKIRYPDVVQMPCFVSHLTKSVLLKQSHQ
ncbi:unnamed protein product [Mytilus coruscus]|uniref:Uncharacterized protein n=1 Tax=Mytilus coruscus TaxID=42192 RepID=A0A6J8CC09_MYTCO|nr:unnamed protein product [Mytilus coruscus]